MLINIFFGKQAIVQSKKFLLLNVFVSLSEDDDAGEDDCAHADAEDAVHEVAADDRQYHVRPRVERVERRELVRRHVHRVLKRKMFYFGR